MKTNLDLSRPHFEFAREEQYYVPSAELLPAVNWSPPTAGEVLAWTNAKVVCLDVEVRDETLKELGPGCRRDPSRNYVVGYGVAIEDGPSWYLPVKHHGGDNCDWDVRGYLREQLRHFRGTLVLNGGGYDLDWTATDLGDDAVLNCDVDDVQIRDPLIYDLHDRYGLEELCLRYDLPGKDEAVLEQAASAYRVHKKIGLWRLPARFVAAYGVADVQRPLLIRRRQIPKMAEEGVEQIWNLERRVTSICVKMRRRGVRIDVDHLETVERLALLKENEHLDAVRAATGVTISRDDVWKPKVLAHALKAGGYDVPKTERREQINKKTGEKTGKMTGGQDSVDIEFLSKAGKVGRDIMRARKWNKLRSTFCAQIREHMIDHGDEYRVHCTFNQLKTTDEVGGDDKGVRYGRFSSTDYNLQGQPIRDKEFGPLFRQIYVADKGARWACSDWSQQEPRIGVHYAEILKLPGAKEFADEYRRNPRLDVHQKLTDIADDPVNYPRDIVKNFVNGCLYGIGDVKLCRQFGWPVESYFDHREQKYRERASPEAKAKINGFEEFAPWIRKLVAACADAVDRNDGHVWTWLRRKCHFVKGPDGKWWKKHKAFSRVGQGTAADQMKSAAVECERQGIQLQFAVHDEFDFSFYDIRQAILVSEIQRNIVKLNVPMITDLEIGDSWGKMEKFCLKCETMGHNDAKCPRNYE